MPFNPCWAFRAEGKPGWIWEPRRLLGVEISAHPLALNMQRKELSSKLLDSSWCNAPRSCSAAFPIPTKCLSLIVGTGEIFDFLFTLWWRFLLLRRDRFLLLPILNQSKVAYFLSKLESNQEPVACWRHCTPSSRRERSPRVSLLLASTPVACHIPLVEE